MDIIAIIVHGFAGSRGFMKEIEDSLSSPPFTEYYSKVWNLTYYSSSHGLDFSLPYDLMTPIYSRDTKQTLSHKLFYEIDSRLQDHPEEVYIDFFSHSMGGLVTRALLTYLATPNRNLQGLRIGKGIVRKVHLLGTPNRGTRLAQRAINIPLDILLSGLNLILELPRGGITREDFDILKSQFIQMIPKSTFLKRLNKPRKERMTILRSLKWVTVRGLNSSGLLGIVWQPLLFRKFWIDRNSPFLHPGIIPNDGLVDGSSVPLPYARNFTSKNATHMDLLRWKNNPSGQRICQLIQRELLSNPLS
ncbi:MAG: esterase/lipase family protein [Candidatus Heimdallarchaeota archaeon]